MSQTPAEMSSIKLPTTSTFVSNKSPRENFEAKTR
jgi:hypothetical protein